MDEKQIGELKTVGIRGRKFPFVGLTLLLLTFILACSVAANIYFAKTTHDYQQSGQKGSVNLEADVKVQTEDGKQENEKISYDQISKTAYYYGAEGAFTADDFGKGIRLTKDVENGVCYLTPVGVSDPSDHHLETFLKSRNEKLVQVNSTVAENYEVLPGEIEDLSIIPQRAHTECTNGYRWMVPSTTEAGQGRRFKRDTKHCYLCTPYARVYQLVRHPVTRELFWLRRTFYRCRYTATVNVESECPDE